MNVLIVDDVADNAELLRRFITRRGHTVFVASNGLEGVDMTLAHRPDMIFMDISMPIMSGLEATQIIRKDPNVCNTPIIALTAHAMAQDRDDCLKAGCDGFATKPIDFQDINGFLVEYAPESFPPARSVS